MKNLNKKNRRHEATLSDIIAYAFTNTKLQCIPVCHAIT